MLFTGIDVIYINLQELFLKKNPAITGMDIWKTFNKSFDDN